MYQPNPAGPGMPASGHARPGTGTAAQGTGHTMQAASYRQQPCYVPVNQYPPPHGPYSHDINRPLPGTAPQPSQFGSWFDFSSAGYLKGFLAGTGITLLLTNTGVQKALIRGTVKVWSTFQGGVEEVKEQFKDVKAEMSQES
jgi:hypothetical protein